MAPREEEVAGSIYTCKGGTGLFFSTILDEQWDPVPPITRAGCWGPSFRGRALPDPLYPHCHRLLLGGGWGPGALWFVGLGHVVTSTGLGWVGAACAMCEAVSGFRDSESHARQGFHPPPGGPFLDPGFC